MLTVSVKKLELPEIACYLLHFPTILVVVFNAKLIFQDIFAYKISILVKIYILKRRFCRAFKYVLNDETVKQVLKRLLACNIGIHVNPFLLSSN